MIALGRRNDVPLGDLRDSTGVLGDTDALRKRFADDGYLLLRGLLPRDVVLAGRRHVIDHLEGKGVAVGGDATVATGAPPIFPLDEVMRDTPVLAVVEHEALFALTQQLVGTPTLTFPYKWLRAMGPTKFSGAHMDVVYFPRGSQRVITCWIPFGDVAPDHGTLTICRGAHADPEFARLRETYGEMDIDRDRVDGGGWFTDDPGEVTDLFGSEWLTASFAAGDVLLFGMRTLHASTTNNTSAYRISCDVRFQPIEDPVDPRYTEPVLANEWLGTGQPPRLTLAQARAKWGV